MKKKVQTNSVVLEDQKIALTTIEGVEIGKVGDEWPAATGPFKVTQEDFKSIIASQEDPAIKAPRVKIGHDSFLTPDDPDSVFGGKPVFGKFTNLRLTDNDNTLVGDISGIPKWAADVLPYAWPSRSGEWLQDWDNFGTAKTKYPMVLTAVALLGVELPGITTIQDLPAFFTAEGPEGVKVIVDGALVRANSKEGATKTTTKKTTGNVVITSIDSADVRESFFNDFAPYPGDRQWWWPTDVFISPMAVIADDDEGGLWFVAYTVGDDDTITWDDPVATKHQFVNKEDGVVLAGAAQAAVLRSASADVVRPPERRRSKSKTETKKEASPVKPEIIQKVRDLHGLTVEQLPDDADDAALEAALNGIETPTPEPVVPEPVPEPEPAAAGVRTSTGGTVTIDAEAWAETQRTIARLDAKDQTAEKTARENDVAKAITDRKIPPSRKAHYTKLMESDPVGTRELLNSLEKNAVPGGPIGTDEDIAMTRSAIHGTGLIPELAREPERSAA